MTFPNIYTPTFFKKIGILLVCLVYVYVLGGFAPTFADLSRADIIKSIITKRNQIRLAQETPQIQQEAEITIPENDFRIVSRITLNSPSNIYQNPLVPVEIPTIEAPKITCYGIHEVEIVPYMYHYIRQAHRDPINTGIWNNSITPDSAREQFAHLGMLQETTETGTIFLSELTTYQESNCFPYKKNIILTFDDGRRDNYNYLLPLAQKYNIKMNLGIIVNRISRGERIDPFMTGQEIQMLIDSGWFEIQSHSRSHGNLANMNRNTQRKEICGSKTWIEETFGIQVDSFIYPMGLYNGMSVQIAEQCGYKNALTTHTWNKSINNELSRYPYELSRTRTHRGSTGQSLFGE